MLAKNSDKVSLPFKSQFFTYSRMDENRTTFSLDVYAFQCKPYKNKSPLQILISCNPPICFKNLLFSDLVLYNVSAGNTIERKIKPTEYSYMYNYIHDNFGKKDKNKKGRNTYQWAFQKDRYTTIVSKEDYLYNLTQEVEFHSPEYYQSKSGAHDPSLATICFEANDFEVRNNEYEKFSLRDIKFSSSLSKFVLVYSPYMIINKSNVSLTIGIGKKKNDLEVYPQQTEYFCPGKETKLHIKSEEYDWSNSFEFKTIGVAGMLSLKKSGKGQSYRPTVKEYNASEMDIGVSLSSLDSKFYKTLAITFSPRYIICNTLNVPLLLMSDHKDSKIMHRIEPNSEKPYYLENKAKENCLRICQDTDDPSFTTPEWSSKFCIDDVADYQIAMRVTPEESKEEFENGKNQWFVSSPQNGFRRYIRVMIATKDNATLFISFADPYNAEVMVNNKTRETFTFKQKDGQISLDLPAETKVPFVWESFTSSHSKEITICSDKEKKDYKLDEIKRLKDISSKSTVFTVEVKAEKNHKEVVIEYKKKDEIIQQKKKFGLFELLLVQKLATKCLQLIVDLQGIVLSVIDSDPKEVVLLSIHKPSINYVRRTGFNRIETDDELDIVINHAQIDNMSTGENPVIFCPKKLLDKEKENAKVDEEVQNTPFIQLKLERETIKHKNSLSIKYPCIMIAVQEMLLHVETGTLNNILGVVNKIFKVFVSQVDEFRSAMYASEKYSMVEDSKSDFEVYRKEELCPSLETSIPSIRDDEYLRAEKSYFEFINIGAMRIILTLRFEHKNLNVSVKQGFGAYSIVYTLLTSIASVSDSPLTFRELIMTHSYSVPLKLLDMILKNFTRQGMMQFYKLIGSSDLLGNPVSFVDKLGSGVYEFINEPKKGLLKGPKGFVGGVGKGVGSLVGNFTSATFGSFSKISGSLYNVTKDLSGQSVKREDGPKSFAEGMLKGAKGGVSEITSGITGLITNPIKETKKGGMLGLFKGVGKGVVGAVASPFAATLKLASDVTQGISGTTVRLLHGKVQKQGRYRHPRYINPAGALEIYDDKIAEAQLILSIVNKGKYSDELIRFITRFYSYKKEGVKTDEVICIITDRHFIVVKDLNNVQFKGKIKDLKEAKMTTEGLDQQSHKNISHLMIKNKKKKAIMFSSDEYNDIVKAFEILRA